MITQNNYYKLQVGGEVLPSDDIVFPDQNILSTTNITKNKYIELIQNINDKYNDFKKSLYAYALEQQLSNDELDILLPKNDEPYIDNSNVDKLLSQKYTTMTINISNNNSIIDLQSPFYQPPININS